jgi:hypothetical protein
MNEGDASADKKISDHELEVSFQSKSFKDRIIISCENPYKAVFDIIILLLVGYSCVTTVYLVSFNPEIHHGDFTYYFDQIVEYSFILDLLLNFI